MYSSIIGRGSAVEQVWYEYGCLYLSISPMPGVYPYSFKYSSEQKQTEVVSSLWCGFCAMGDRYVLDFNEVMMMMFLPAFHYK